MTFAAKGLPPGQEDGPIAVCLSPSSAADVQTNSPPRQNTQIQFQPTEAEFDCEITLAMTASGRRLRASLLTLAALLIEAGDCLSAERDRQRAREQFVEASDLFKLFQEVQRAVGIVAEAFR